MKILSPSILSADFANLQRDLQKIADDGCRWVHVDVMDGNFVPNISIGMPVVKACRKVTDLTLDVHLMIDRPVRYVEEFVRSGADWVTVHVEADTEENILLALEKIKAMGAKAGVSVKPGTPAEAVKPFLPYCDLILVMTVEPGFGGQKFMADMMPKLKCLKEMVAASKPDCLLSVDGGVDSHTYIPCTENGADVLVSGSSYFKAADGKAFAAMIQG